jgi:hypothetical protein
MKSVDLMLKGITLKGFMSESIHPKTFQQPFQETACNSKPLPEGDERWRSETISGRIYSQLEVIGKAEEKTYKVIGKGTSHEVFQLGDQKARIRKKLVHGSVGYSNGDLKGFYEFWEYKRYPWWQKIISQLSNNVLSPLPVPLFRAAEDAGVANPQNIFLPEKVIELYMLVDAPKKGVDYVKEEYWVKHQIVSLMNERLNPNYEVEEFFNLLRLIPQNDQAKKDDLGKEGVYNQSLTAILEVSNELQMRFEKRSQEKNKPQS